MENIISVKGLKKSFKKNHVLKGVSFDVRKGKIFALLGSNGAGKTTCVRILATLSRADGGTVTICGHDIARDAKKVRENISLTGQYAAVDEALTGRENLQLIA
ncbi:MAG: ATP-binding cassette domain-containing protein, partial [Defluviitaleaceae bacterium]|nr:ATP-binding cassette domain-containing protein [Defluviitaleaceae bacterium]